jgi:hypothetical protein
LGVIVTIGGFGTEGNALRHHQFHALQQRQLPAEIRVQVTLLLK